jgi:hypothetical protein
MPATDPPLDVEVRSGNCRHAQNLHQTSTWYLDDVLSALRQQHTRGVPT